jgi:DNA-binding Lrp family transcriptional regulator
MKAVSSASKDRTKEIIKALQGHPRASDREVARIVGTISQPTVTRHRQYIQEKGLLRFVAIPKYSDQGYSVLAISTLLVKDEETIHKAKNDKRIIATFIWTDLCTISIHKSIIEYREFLEEYTGEVVFLTDIETGIVKDFDFSKI